MKDFEMPVFKIQKEKKIVGFTVIALSFRVLLPSENAK